MIHAIQLHGTTFSLLEMNFQNWELLGVVANDLGEEFPECGVGFAVNWRSIEPHDGTTSPRRTPTCVLERVMTLQLKRTLPSARGFTARELQTSVAG